MTVHLLDLKSGGLKLFRSLEKAKEFLHEVHVIFLILPKFEAPVCISRPLRMAIELGLPILDSFKL